MSDRRSLVQGLKTKTEPDRALEEQFVYPDRAKEASLPPPMGVAASETASGQSVAAANRVPFTTRIRGDLALALKRSSLERQLEGVQPNTVQDILEAALEPWLRANGYLK